MKQRLFGTDGVRGVAGQPPLTPELTLRLGHAIGHVLSRGRPGAVVVVRDTRVSGPVLESALTAGLLAAGINVYSGGVLPTPAVARLVLHKRCLGGVVISASHNVFSDNGIKVFGGDGYKLDDEGERAIEAHTGVEMPPFGPTSPGRIYPLHNAEEIYTDALLESLADQAPLSGLHVVMDLAHGAAFSVGPRVFKAAGALVNHIGDRPDGMNINRQVGALHPQHLGDQVRLLGAHMGVALDGDADRCVLVDEKGQVVDGDAILGLWALALHRKGRLPGARVVATTMSNLGLEVWLASQGIGLLRTDVGDRFVVEALRREQLVLGGEQSGHMIHLGFTTTGDGLLTALQLASLVVASGLPLSEMVGVIPRYPQVLHNVRIQHRRPLENLPRVQEAIQTAHRRLGDKGRVVVRFSGTEPIARVMIEGPNQQEIERLALSIGDHILEELG